MLSAHITVIAILTLFKGGSWYPGDEDATKQADQVLRLWPSDPPPWTLPKQEEHDTSTVQSRQVAGEPVVRLGFVSQPELHLFLAEKDRRSETFVIVCPGGGYSILAWDLEGTEIARWLQSIGVTAAVLKYRVPTRHIEEKAWRPPVQDIQRSVSLARDGLIPGFKPKRIGLLGFSAGGNAVVRAATTKQRLYKAVDRVDEISFAPDFGVLVYPAWLVKQEDPTQLLADIEVSDDTPPMFLAHAQDDGITCLGSVTLFSELKRRNIAAALHIFASGGHGFGARKTGEAKDRWPSLCEAWMRDQGWL